MKKACITCRYCFSRIKPVIGLAHPSLSTCSHCKSRRLISRAGSCLASSRALTKRFPVRNNSRTSFDALADGGMIP